jgi:hypothetical protein
VECYRPSSEVQTQGFATSSGTPECLPVVARVRGSRGTGHSGGRPGKVALARCIQLRPFCWIRWRREILEPGRRPVKFWLLSVFWLFHPFLIVQGIRSDVNLLNPKRVESRRRVWRVHWARNACRFSKDENSIYFIRDWPVFPRWDRTDLCVKNTTGEAYQAMREVTRNYDKIEEMATSRCK